MGVRSYGSGKRKTSARRGGKTAQSHREGKEKRQDGEEGAQVTGWIRCDIKCQEAEVARRKAERVWGSFPVPRTGGDSSQDTRGSWRGLCSHPEPGTAPGCGITRLSHPGSAIPSPAAGTLPLSGNSSFPAGCAELGSLSSSSPSPGLCGLLAVAAGSPPRPGQNQKGSVPVAAPGGICAPGAVPHTQGHVLVMVSPRPCATQC